MGLNVGTYNIQYRRGFGLLQEIWSVERGKYYLMLLTEEKIPDAVYFRKRMGYDVF